MSAITGIFYRDGRKVEPELIKKMNDKISHRGPDGSAVWCEGSIALGHQMLWTTPESLHEKLPFPDKESGLVITADARIDNRKELSEKLEIGDKEDVSDSYFILKAYEKWGEKCPEYLLGDFAFAIWDENEEKLFCARDHMGVKPFYYYLDDEKFVFGTEIKAFFCVQGVFNNLNELKVALYLMEIDDNKSTFYEDILRLIPAHFIIIDNNKNNMKRYWKLDADLEIKMESDEDYIKAFREIFAEAVNCRLRSAFPLGFELSGGLDSSSVTCMSKKLLKENRKSNSSEINTFSYVYDDFPQCDESYYIKKVVETGGIKPYYIHADKFNFLEQIDEVLWYQEQPFFTPYMIFMWNLCKKAHNNNIRILLSGNGGDIVVSYATYYFLDLAVSFKWKKLIKEIRYFSKNYNLNFHNILLQRVIFLLIPGYIKNLIYSNKGRPDISILNIGIVTKLEIEKYLNNFHLKHLRGDSSKKYHYSLLNPFSEIFVMETLDNNASAFEIEMRHPFYDKRLVEFCYAIPTDMKFKFGWSRYILRAAMDGILPIENQWRLLKATTDPIYHNFLSSEKNIINKIINDNNLLALFMDLNKINELHKKCLDGNKDIRFRYIWFAILLSLWLKDNIKLS